MPLYEYRCTQCGHHFEKIQSFNAAPETECPRCHGLLERPLSAPALQFKGAGWYVNDYAGKASGGSSSSTASGTASDTPSPSETKPAAADAAKPAAPDTPAKPSTPASSSST